jgi:hypothetical protein
VYRLMNGDHDAWDWFWMIPMMLIWIALLGCVGYAASVFRLGTTTSPALRISRRSRERR